MSSLPLYKIVIAGDENVGKSSLVRQYCEGRFETSRISTIGVDFQTRVVTLPEGDVKLSIWDMAGQDRFEVVRSGLYRGTRATALVYDLTNPKTLEHLQQWFEETRANSTCQKFVVVGNKSDLVSTRDTKTAEKFAQLIGADHLITSAATSEGVGVLFSRLAEMAHSIS
ncbi:MAG: GTP-binding protein [Anaerolineaceae bacterium]|nr:GTP-binding protein [Anaerolineaceae bacterium]MBN2677306.1 GTP-binding protein [Anaerolineaceae bacterium]